MTGMSDTMMEFLDKFAGAWNRHDLDTIMSMMTADCVFEASAGDAVTGQRYEGQEAVRASFAAVFEQFPDAHWGGAAASSPAIVASRMDLHRDITGGRRVR